MAPTQQNEATVSSFLSTVLTVVDVSAMASLSVLVWSTCFSSVNSAKPLRSLYRMLGMSAGCSQQPQLLCSSFTTFTSYVFQRRKIEKRLPCLSEQLLKAPVEQKLTFPAKILKINRGNKTRLLHNIPSNSSPPAESPLRRSELAGCISGKTFFLFSFLNYIALNLILFTVDNVLIFQRDPSVPQHSAHFCNTCTLSRLGSCGNNELSKRSLDLTQQ